MTDSTTYRDCKEKYTLILVGCQGNEACFQKLIFYQKAVLFKTLLRGTVCFHTAVGIAIMLPC